MSTRLGPILLMALIPAGCTGDGRRESPAVAIDRALAAGTRALIVAQDSDGGWRSRMYGVLKDPLALTPTLLKAVVFAPDIDGSARSRRRGAEFLRGRVNLDRSIDFGPHGPAFPVYAAAEAVIILSRPEFAGPETISARNAWLEILRSRQLAESLGWDPGDPAFGAWGDAVVPSRNAGPGTTADADISSTLFAIGALRVAGAEADDPAIVRALTFLIRCQNLATPHSEPVPSFDDGGFFFSPTDPVRNKAGVAGTDRSGRLRFHSYGSATADGLRALMRCGLSPGHPRVQAARRWLEKNFSATHNPGVFELVRESERNAAFYYYAWSIAHAFRALGGRMEEGPGRGTAWAERLAETLIRHQRGDGTWSNRYTASKEDDPLVATPLALGSLGLCRAFIAK
jgi:hypothetical protein